ncbi:MAG: hypothetical protein ABH816_02250 [Candidatus Levyibacteriota bacterium]
MFLNFLAVFFNFFYFLIAIFFALYIPGNILNNKILHVFGSKFEKIVVNLIVGLVLWSYQGFIFGFLDLRFLSYFYLVFFFYLWVRNKSIKNLKSQLFGLIKIKPNYFLAAIFILGIFGQVQQFLITGWSFSKGIFILTASSDDAFWHASLINQIVSRFPPIEPGLSGVLVRNYHYLSNLTIAEFVRVFNLPLLPTQFIYSYLLISFLLGAVAYVLAKTLNFSKIGIILLVYFQYFNSDIIYLLTLATRRLVEFKVSPLEDGTMLLENPPRAFSYVVLLAGIIFLFYWLKTKNLRFGILMALLFGSLIGFKVNTGVPALLGLSLLGIYFILKKEVKMVFVLLLTVFISFCIYLPVNREAGFLLFAPFEMSRMFIVQPGLNISHFELARRIYASHFNFLQSIRMDLTIFIIFFVSQFGIANIGFIAVKNMLLKFNKLFVLFIYSTILFSIILGTFFIQPVAFSDIFNFYLTSSLLLFIPSAFILSSLFLNKSKLLKVSVIILILLMTVPRWINKTQSFAGYFNLNTPAIPRNELDAMQSLQDLTKSNEIVLVFNKGQWDSMYPYVSIFTKRDMFLSGQTILSRHSIPFEDRAKIVEKIISSKDMVEIRGILIENKIGILYFYGEPNLSIDISKVGVKTIFKNNAISIYRVI